MNISKNFHLSEVAKFRILSENDTRLFGELKKHKFILIHNILRASDWLNQILKNTG